MVEIIYREGLGLGGSFINGRHPLYLTFTVSLAHNYFQALNAWEEDNRRDPYGENVESP